MSSLHLASPAGYEAAVSGCALVDRSERGKLALTGSGAKTFLHGQVSNDIESLTPGTGVYAALLSQKGRMRGDLRVLDAGDELLLDTERVALQDLFNTVHRYSIGYDVQLHKRTLQSGLLSLLGPRTGEILTAADPALGEAFAGLADGPEHGHTAAALGGRPVLLVRTDLGIDVLCAAEDTAAIATALEAAGAQPVDEAVAEIARVESGRPRYGLDLDDSVIPQEAGLNDRAVSFTKGCYVGQETVARLFYRGKPNRRLMGLVLSGPAPSGTEFAAADGRAAGRLGSVVESPRHGVIGLALIRREVELGAELEGGGVSARVVDLPFAPAAP